MPQTNSSFKTFCVLHLPLYVFLRLLRKGREIVVNSELCGMVFLSLFLFCFNAFVAELNYITSAFSVCQWEVDKPLVSYEH
jgi:hypothetical protein